MKDIARKQWVACGTSRGQVLMVDLETGVTFKRLKAYHRDQAVTDIAIHPEEPYFLTCSSNSSQIYLWVFSTLATKVCCYQYPAYFRQFRMHTM